MTAKFTLDRMVIHLLHRASQKADEAFEQHSRGSELTARQFTVLAAVSHDERPSQTEIVLRTGIDRSTLAEMMRRLIRRGLAQRRRRRDDARAYSV